MLNDDESALLEGETARKERCLADASKAFARATDYFRGVGDQTRLAHALSREAHIARDAKRPKDAWRFQEEAVNLARQAGSPSLPHVIRHLADILQEDGDASRAALLYDEVTSRILRQPTFHRSNWRTRRETWPATLRHWATRQPRFTTGSRPANNIRRSVLFFAVHTV